MCFYIKTPRKTAEEDIVTYKLLNKDLSSIHHNFSYKLGEKQKEIRLKEDSTSIIDITDDGFYTQRLIHEGYHSYSTYWRAKRISFLSSRVIVECIIPKGSEYYSDDEAEEIVSSNIIIKKIINRTLGKKVRFLESSEDVYLKI